MTKVINLRTKRKQKARAEKLARASVSDAPTAARRLAERQNDLAARRLDGAKRDKPETHE